MTTDSYIVVGLGVVLCLSLVWYLWMRARARGEDSIVERQHSTSHEPLDEVNRLLRQGDKGEALRRYQASTNASPAEAKQAVDALDMGMPTSAFGSSFSTPEVQLGQQIEQLLAEGRKISAIQFYREQTGASLKEAKEAVEAVQGNPLPTPSELDMARGQQDDIMPPAPAKLDDARARSIEAEIRRFLSDGRKIPAIKLYRDYTGVGLKEAKEAIEAVQRDMLNPEPAGSAIDRARAIEEQLRGLLAEGKKISAVQLYRQHTGVGLKEAKEAVERLER
jgi:ribosomal protein L7/L12